MKKIDLKRFVPAGMEYEKEVNGFWLGLILSVVYSLIFVFRYMEARQALYEWTLNGYVLHEYAVMPDFAQLIKGLWVGFWIVLPCTALVAGYHYLYHYQGSKSIYVMRRLPNRWELHKRCLALPLVGLMICAGCMLLLLLIYYGIYQGFTPRECLTPDQWAKIWR